MPLRVSKGENKWRGGRLDGKACVTISVSLLHVYRHTQQHGSVQCAHQYLVREVFQSWSTKLPA